MTDLKRPYLVIPKLIEQPTWGGQYIVTTKGWLHHSNWAELKIGQSYELFSGSNLSLLTSSEDPNFTGELTDRDAVANLTRLDNALSLHDLVSASPEDVLGIGNIAARGPTLQLLIKYTQALGNSFQVHIRDGVKSPTWKPKPESWYYFEPGLITLGAKPNIDWDSYRKAVEAIEAGALSLSQEVKAGSLNYDKAQSELTNLVQKHDPWQFVNTVAVDAGQLVDMSMGGIHHSWEEDTARAPLGNVLLELQFEAMDKISTFRSFDKGKMEPGGTVRSLQIPAYFEAIDRSPEANQPSAHMRQPKPITQSMATTLENLLASKHYNLDRLTLSDAKASYTEGISGYKHLFAKSGRVSVTAGHHTVTLTAGHSCFIPALAQELAVSNLSDTSEVLISY